MIQHASQTCLLGVHPNQYDHFDSSLARKMPQRYVLTPDLCLFCLFSLKCRCQRQMFCFAFSVRSGRKVPNGHRVGSCQGTCCTNHLLQRAGSRVIQKDCAFLRWVPKSTGFGSLEVARRIGIHIEFRVTSQLTMAKNQQ